MKDYFAIRILQFVIFVVMIFVSCARQTLVLLEPEDELERAMGFFNNKKYDGAIQSFERIIFYYATSEFVDDAQFYLARSYFEKKDYSQAITEFEYLIKNFPNTPFIEEAYLYRAKAYFFRTPGYDRDQTETKEAIGLFDEFLTKFPNSKFAEEVKRYILSARNRLAKKELENGKLYLKLKEMKAAELYFNYVLENFPETACANEAKYNLALVYEKIGKTDEALRLYKELLEESSWQKKAEKSIKKLESKNKLQ